MKVGNQPLPVSARVAAPSSSPRNKPKAAASVAGSGSDRVEISPEASEALAAGRLGLATGLTRGQVEELVARSNREASRTVQRVDLEKILALLR